MCHRLRPPRKGSNSRKKGPPAVEMNTTTPWTDASRPRRMPFSRATSAHRYPCSFRTKAWTRIGAPCWRDGSIACCNERSLATSMVLEAFPTRGIGGAKNKQAKLGCTFTLQPPLDKTSPRRRRSVRWKTAPARRRRRSASSRARWTSRRACASWGIEPPSTPAGKAALATPRAAPAPLCAAGATA